VSSQNYKTSIPVSYDNEQASEATS